MTRAVRKDEANVRDREAAKRKGINRVEKEKVIKVCLLTKYSGVNLHTRNE